MRAARLRLTVHSAAEQAVLREMRVFALKPVAEAACSYTAEMRSGMPDAAWADAPEVAGFLDRDATRFAATPTAVRLCRNRAHLFIGVTAYEPRMHAMLADMTDRDATLWTQESVEVRLQADDGPMLRFVVNPNGARYDAEAVLLGERVAGWDAGWDGGWEVMTKRNEDAWAAVFAIPFETLGERPRAGDRWRANFLRHRFNIDEEHSAWEHDHEQPGREVFGEIVFN